METHNNSLFARIKSFFSPQKPAKKDTASSDAGYSPIYPDARSSRDTDRTDTDTQDASSDSSASDGGGDGGGGGGDGGS